MIFYSSSISRIFRILIILEVIYQKKMGQEFGKLDKTKT